jgi:hypothetical protein
MKSWLNGLKQKVRYKDSTKYLVVVFFILNDSPASEFYVPTFRNTVCDEISAYKIYTPEYKPKEGIQHSEHGENLKSRTN